MWSNKTTKKCPSFRTLTAFLNLMQKSWKMRKHSSNLKVSLSSQKKSMSALPSLRRSILRLFRSWSVCAEFWDGTKTHFLFILCYILAKVIRTWVSSARNAQWPASNFLYMSEYISILHNCCYVTCRKGSSCCSSSSSPWTFSSRDLIRTYKEENSNSMFSTEILHEGIPATRTLVMKSHYHDVTDCNSPDNAHCMTIYKRG